jgi:hypothetical protein
MSDQFVRQEQAEWDRVRHGLKFPVYDGVSPNLAAETTAHNDAVKAISDRLAAATAAVESAIADVDAGNVGDFMTACAQSQFDRGYLIQAMAKLWAQREALADKTLAEFKAAVAPAEAEYESTLAAVKVELEKIGCGVAAQPAYGVGDTASADVQLTWLAANRNTRTAAAKQKLAEARGLVEAATVQQRSSVEGRELIQQFASRLARKLAAI